MHKRKIGIINHWMVNNYGALLLAYALEKKIKKLGYDVESITYLPDEVEKPWLPTMIKKIGFLNYILRLGYFLVFILPRQKAFSSLRKQMATSSIKYNDKNLHKIDNVYDKVIIGGDQLWNCKINYFNENNFLPFIKDKNKKVVYAASLAQNNMRSGFEEIFKNLAEDFSYVTTREIRATQIIEELTCLQAPRVADPAFLLTSFEWEQLCLEDKKQKKKFIFVYQVQSDISVINFAKKISKEKNLEIIYCPFPLKKHIKCRIAPYISPQRWLWYIKNAEYVITDAFHGTVFSIIFNKKFVAEISEYGKDTSSRITNILKLCNLEDHLLVDGDCEAVYDEINYIKINEFIDKDREDAVKHLKAMLE